MAHGLRSVRGLGAGWLGAALALGPAIGHASTLTLSELSSDSTPAAVLDATLEFVITGLNELTLDVTNDTSAPDTYFINFVYFNAGPDVLGLSLDSATSSSEGDVSSGWTLNTSVSADGFGTFDFELADGVGNDPDQIGPAETVSFVFTFSGSNVDMSDFTSFFSTIPPGSDPSLAAAKFVRGPGDDSAFGATTVPEPTAWLLLGLACTLLGVKRALVPRTGLEPARPYGH